VKIAAIINPISGAGAHRDASVRRIAALTSQLDRRGLRASTAITTRAGHARELAEHAVADGADLVIVWGGDGTLNEVGAALLGTATAIGLVPAGSGNGLAGALATPRDPDEAIARALDGPRRRIDAGTIARRPFFNIAGIGVDARIARRFNERKQGTRGAFPYFVIGITEGCRYTSREYEVELDGEGRRLRALLIAFANGSEYGIGARISAAASLDDGLLDAVVVEDRSVFARFLHARHLASGMPERAPGVIVRRIQHAVIRSRDPIEYHVDGEAGVSQGEVEVSILPGALLVQG
jgi:YegS/Rv2252/BmrU family lipid kinase